ncbi:MAG: hypothetical protein R3B72_50070 [Polyangiaceae bacterium]
MSELLYPLLFPWYFGASVHNALPLLQVAELGAPSSSGWSSSRPTLVAVAHLIERWRFGVPLRRTTLKLGWRCPAWRPATAGCA